MGRVILFDTEQILVLFCSTFPGCRCGRKTALQSGTLLMITMGTSAALAPSFPAYCVLRFLSGMAMTGIIITSLCLSECPCGAPAPPPTAVRPGAGGGGHFR